MNQTIKKIVKTNKKGTKIREFDSSKFVFLEIGKKSGKLKRSKFEFLKWEKIWEIEKVKMRILETRKNPGNRNGQNSNS